jgi:predicted ATPase
MSVVSPVFVGRTDEFALLESAMRRAADGDPPFVLISGKAGVGKTRLIDGFAAHAGTAGYLV